MNKTKRSIITFHTKDGTFIAFPPDNEKLCVKAERTAKGQMITVGYFNIPDKTWSFVQGAKVPYSVRSVIEERYA